MTTQSTALPNLFIGIDIHKKSWAVHLRTDIGEHRPMTIPARKELLFDYVQSNFGDHCVHVAYEAGCCGFSAARYFLSLGWRVSVVNAADIPRSDKQQYQKTDRYDCRNISKQLSAGQLHGIYVPTEDQDELKSLVRQRASLTRLLRKTKTQIKALLLYHGIEIPQEFDNPNWSKAFKTWLANLAWETEAGKLCLHSKLDLLATMHYQYLSIANSLRAYCRKHFKKDYYLLKSIPGVGGYLASCILAEVGDLRRFDNEAQFASFIGLVPVMYNSGGNEKVFGVTPRCRSLLRSYIIESAWVALRRDPQMQAYYRKHVGRNPKSIIIKIARKMLNRMLSVIKREQIYKINYSPSTKSL